jgi:UDP-2,4-diacetamido-2,4,6-trideoxy-beta-L-altropyranose hydrolase
MGTEVDFICRDHKGHLGAVITARGYAIHWLPAPPSEPAPNSGDDYAAWLGVPWATDAAETIAALATLEPDWVVVDHYGLDARWEELVGGATGRILVLDDLANRPHHCHLLLDQGIQGSEDRYAALTQNDCRTLLGPDYALLASDYAALHRVARRRRGLVRRVLVYFGGSDPDDLTGRALRAIVSVADGLAIDVVVGGSYTHGEGLAAFASGYEGVTIHHSLPSLAPLMMEADLAIGSAGTTSWERICLRLPALVLVMADNQLPNARLLDEVGVIRWIGDTSASQSALAAAIAPCLTGSSDELWPKIDRLEVDGLGAARVAAVMLAGPDMPLKARRAVPSDERLLLDWANDPDTRRNAFSQQRITPEGHHMWFAARLADPSNCLMAIVESGLGAAVGQVRFDRVGQDWTISYVVAPPFRGRGLGRRILELAMPMATEAAPSAGFIALVKPENAASKRIFQRLGFALVSEDAGTLKLWLNRSMQTPQ